MSRFREKQRLKLKTRTGLRKGSPTQELLDEDLIRRAIWDCLKEGDAAGVIEVIKEYLAAVKKTEVAKRASLSNSRFLKFLMYTIRLGFLVISSLGFSEIIWESLPTEKTFSFSNYSDVFVAPTLGSSSREKMFTEMLSKKLQNKAKIQLEDSPEQIFNLMGKSRLWLYVSVVTTEDPSIHLLQVFASVGAKANVSKEEILALPWKKTFLLVNENQLDQDISKALDGAIDDFIEHYFSKREKKGRLPHFYVSQI